MRYIRYAFLLALAVVLSSVLLANRGMVELRLLPEGLAAVPGLGPFDLSIELPLFAVVLIGIAAGLIIGFLWEWVREHKHRQEASVKGREVRKLEREVGKLKRSVNADRDEILGLLEEAR